MIIFRTPNVFGISTPVLASFASNSILPEIVPNSSPFKNLKPAPSFATLPAIALCWFVPVAITKSTRKTLRLICRAINTLRNNSRAIAFRTNAWCRPNHKTVR